MIVLFNPLSTTPGKQPLPLSLLSLAAVLEGRWAWSLVDGNTTAEPYAAIAGRLEPENGSRSVLAVTVMPGPQLAQATDISRRVKALRPTLPIVWGGYFPTQHADVVLRAPYVDVVIRSQGERPLLALLAALRDDGPLQDIPGLSWKRGGEIVHNLADQPVPLDELPDLPYHRLPMARYLQRTYLGRRTAAQHTSFGCPFACSFCAVVAMSHRRWLAHSPARMDAVTRHLVTAYGADAVQMHDMDFFISESRTAEYCQRIEDLGIRWWALGRVDTLMRYSDVTWSAMRRSGLKMIFSGAESGSDAALDAMNKGGTASPALTIELVERMRALDIVPELSFVLGCPPDPLADIQRGFEFIRRVKRANPATELILYVYTPVPLDGTLLAEAERHGFQFPETLEEWASPKWRQLSMRRGDDIPWLDADVRRAVRNFERVLNAYYPTVTDVRLTGLRRALLRAVASWRYLLCCYGAPFELRALHRIMQYQRPETTGF